MKSIDFPNYDTVFDCRELYTMAWHFSLSLAGAVAAFWHSPCPVIFVIKRKKESIYIYTYTHTHRRRRSKKSKRTWCLYAIPPRLCHAIKLYSLTTKKLKSYESNLMSTLSVFSLSVSQMLFDKKRAKQPPILLTEKEEEEEKTKNKKTTVSTYCVFFCH